MSPTRDSHRAIARATGLTEARSGGWSPGMIAAVVLNGDETACRNKITEFLQVSGADELILSVMATGADRTASVHRTLDFIGRL